MTENCVQTTFNKSIKSINVHAENYPAINAISRVTRETQTHEPSIEPTMTDPRSSVGTNTKVFATRTNQGCHFGDGPDKRIILIGGKNEERKKYISELKGLQCDPMNHGFSNRLLKIEAQPDKMLWIWFHDKVISKDGHYAGSVAYWTKEIMKRQMLGGGSVLIAAPSEHVHPRVDKVLEWTDDKQYIYTCGLGCNFCHEYVCFKSTGIQEVKCTCGCEGMNRTTNPSRRLPPQRGGVGFSPDSPTPRRGAG